MCGSGSGVELSLIHILIPELQGRFPIRVELENLDKETFLDQIGWFCRMKSSRPDKQNMICLDPVSSTHLENPRHLSAEFLQFWR